MSQIIDSIRSVCDIKVHIGGEKVDSVPYTYVVTFSDGNHIIYSDQADVQLYTDGKLKPLLAFIRSMDVGYIPHPTSAFYHLKPLEYADLWYCGPYYVWKDPKSEEILQSAPDADREYLHLLSKHSKKVADIAFNHKYAVEKTDIGYFFTEDGLIRGIYYDGKYHDLKTHEYFQHIKLKDVIDTMKCVIEELEDDETSDRVDEDDSLLDISLYSSKFSELLRKHVLEFKGSFKSLKELSQ